MDGSIRFPTGRLEFELKPGRHRAEARPGKYLTGEVLMPRQFRVQIDLERLRSHLAEADRETKSAEQIRAFLIDSGFVQTPRGWLVSEADLGVLHPDEVIAIDEVPENG